MKFTVSSSELLNHLQTISRVIPAKASLSILDNFLIDLSGNRIKVTASDTECVMTTTIDVLDVEGEGSFTVPAKILLDPLKELPDQPVTFEVNDDNYEIFGCYQNNGKFNLMGTPGAEYPEVQTSLESSLRQRFTISAARLTMGINNTLFAVAEDTKRPVMSCVNCDIFEDKIVFVASDIHRLVRYTDANVQVGFRDSFLLPKKPATLLKNVLTKVEDDVVVEFGDKNVRFAMGNYVLICRLVEGNYPNYNVVIPPLSPNTITLDRVSFINVLRRIAVFADPAYEMIELTLENNLIRVSSQNVDYSISAKEEVACDYQGNQFKIGFTAMLLIEELSTMTTDEVIISLTDATRAAVLRPVGEEEGQELWMLAMPMFVNR